MTDITVKKTAVLQLVRHILSNECIKPTEGQTPLQLPEKYEDLRDGALLYRILSHIAPQSFPDANEMAEQSPASRMNKVVRKENLLSLVKHMNDYAHQALGAPDTLNLIQLLNAEDIANSPALNRDETNTESEKKKEEEEEEEDKGFLCLMELTDIFIVMVVLSGDSTIMQAVKSLPHAHQVILSNTAKMCITKHALRPRRRAETTTSADSHHSSVVGSSHGGPSSRSTQQQPSSLMEESSQSAFVQQLRRELDDSNAKVMELESTLQLTLKEKQEWESKYKKMMAETEELRVAFAGEEHLRQLLAKKDETVKTLTATAEEYSKKISAFKEATALQETALSAMKRKLKQTEEELIKKNSERREALEKLSLAEERLTAQVNARTDLEKQLEDLRAELALVKVQNHHTNDDGESRLNRSFGSVNSIDRVVMLENELDEARSQKDAAERLLHVLQRQVASLPSEGFKPDAALDALKTQIRQSEKEKEELRNQLALTVARLEEAQTRWRVGGSQSMIDSETGSFMAGSKAGGKDVDGANTQQDTTESVGVQSRTRESSDGSRREQTLLASTVLLLGYRNLVLQQRALLENGLPDSTFYRRGIELESERPAVAGSFLTQHRCEVEEGLVRSVLYRNEWNH
ncbi:uncharacterized protein TM35_000073620 [Trypanosoma theileri]|uniref:Uncharacterized protein n=1 Tax=Trypanosoma theileri TaxID=67003 RepID=A0A1X0P283_9TRYP|nr:uncharacterized protein TM35_000073620 [Trypanosoma theileri]ORC90938.1 hypothetical protein TM35_000073620 [Trypanosoma theileri]